MCKKTESYSIAKILHEIILNFLLIHCNPVFHFCTSWKRQKTKDFQIFSGVIEMKQA